MMLWTIVYKNCDMSWVCSRFIYHQAQKHSINVFFFAPPRKILKSIFPRFPISHLCEIRMHVQLCKHLLYLPIFFPQTTMHMCSCSIFYPLFIFHRMGIMNWSFVESHGFDFFVTFFSRYLWFAALMFSDFFLSHTSVLHTCACSFYIYRFSFPQTTMHMCSCFVFYSLFIFHRMGIGIGACSHACRIAWIRFLCYFSFSVGGEKLVYKLDRISHEISSNVSLVSISTSRRKNKHFYHPKNGFQFFEQRFKLQKNLQL